MQPHDDTTQPHGDHTRDTTERFTVPEAAEILGITAEAVRQRIRRGTLPSEKDEAGSVFVFLNSRKHQTNRQQHNDSTQPHGDSTQPHDDPTTDNTVLYDHMSSEIDYLKSQLDKERESSAELRRIIAALTQRIPELEAPREEREASVTVSEEQGGGAAPPDQEKRPWWRRLFEA
jgi:hypothetical protein